MERVPSALILEFQSTLSMRRATMTRGFRALLLPGTISIHALHEESDRPRLSVGQPLSISIHALHEESDPFAPTDPG